MQVAVHMWAITTTVWSQTTKCTEVLDKDFVDIFALLVFDLEENKVVVELNAEKVEYYIHQGDEVRISAVGELVRRKDSMIVEEFLEGVE